jgi:hypothetical protein
MAESSKRRGLLKGARVYLSGPMDFVASRKDEMERGWRSRVSEVLQSLGVTVFDPWHKPRVRGMRDYGREGLDTADERAKWSFMKSRKGIKVRAALSKKFGETLHIDLRMVDTSDLVIAYCPTNVYSVGTPHELALCRQQRKPVLFVSPPVSFPALNHLREHLKKDAKGTNLLESLVKEVPIKENPAGVPSLWYMSLVGPDHFFDGFGFAPYRKRFGWKEETLLDIQEERNKPSNPLLPYLFRLEKRLPPIWDDDREQWVRNDDWLLWNFPDSKRER